MFNLKLLQQKNLKELKEIGERLNCLPDGDRRLRRNWITALASFKFPETSPGVEPLIEQAASIDDAEPASSQDKPASSQDKPASSQDKPASSQDKPASSQESKFDRIVYPRPVAKSEPKVSQSAIAFAVKNPPAVESDQKPILTTADAWNNADFGEVLHAAEPSGQLNLLEWDVSEPPEPDDYQGDILAFHAAYDRWLLTSELHEIIHTKNEPTIAGTDTKREGAREVSTIAPATPGSDIRSQYDGASIPRHDEGLGNQEGDRILEVARADSGDLRRPLPHQPTELAAPIIPPQAPIVVPQAQSHDSHIKSFDEQRPPGRGDGRGGCLELAIGMLVGHRRSNRQHIGKILAIYKSRRGIWRAKIQPLNKPNFVYFDCSALVEQRLLYDYEMKPGGFIPTGTTFDKTRGEKFEVYSRKVRSAKPTNWTPGQLSELSTFKLKQIARDMEIPAIPGTAGKRSLIRAILAEQAISQEKAAAQREIQTTRATAQKQKSAPASKKRAVASPLGNQLSLFDVAV